MSVTLKGKLTLINSLDLKSTSLNFSSFWKLFYGNRSLLYIKQTHTVYTVQCRICINLPVKIYSTQRKRNRMLLRKFKGKPIYKIYTQLNTAHIFIFFFLLLLCVLGKGSESNSKSF